MGKKKINVKEASNIYNNAKIWQIGFFALNNAATNMFLVLILLVSYYATGIVGLATVLVSSIMTATRIWDGVTDPIIGLLMDRTNGRLGKFRPFMFIGYVGMSISVSLIFFTTHKMPEVVKFPYFILLYLIYILFYTAQTAVTKAGQSVLTNNPRQRPMFAAFNMIYSMLVFAVFGFYTSNILVPKYGSYGEASLFGEATITVIIIAGILTFLAILGIWKKDVPENYALVGKKEKVKFKDMVEIFKGNKPLQMLIIAACSDKLGGSVMGNTVVKVMLFAIIIGNYRLSGQIQMLAMIPSLIMIFIGIHLAKKYGTKKSLIGMTWASIIIYTILVALLIFGDPSTITMGKGMSLYAGAFLLLFMIGNAAKGVAAGLPLPMIPDIIDYELYKNDRYAPGVIGTLFSFVDKVISSFGQLIVGLSVAAIGFKETFPDVDTPYSSSIFVVTLILFAGVLMIAWIATLIAMKHYELDGDRMKEIQQAIYDRKMELKAKEEFQNLEGLETV